MISGWSKAEAVEPSQKGDYSIYADFTFSGNFFIIMFIHLFILFFFVLYIFKLIIKINKIK